MRGGSNPLIPVIPRGAAANLKVNVCSAQEAFVNSSTMDHSTQSSHGEKFWKKNGGYVNWFYLWQYKTPCQVFLVWAIGRSLALHSHEEALTSNQVTRFIFLQVSVHMVIDDYIVIHCNFYCVSLQSNTMAFFILMLMLLPVALTCPPQKAGTKMFS